MRVSGHAARQEQKVNSSHNSTAARFPKGGIVGYPAELTDIEKVRHKRHDGKVSHVNGVKPFADTEIGTQELQEGLEKLGMQLSKRQVEKLRGMSGGSVLSSILQISNNLTENHHYSSSETTTLPTRGSGRKPDSEKNRSRSVGTILCEEKESDRKMSVKIPVDRSSSKNNSDPVRALLAIDDPELSYMNDEVIHLLTPKSTKRADSTRGRIKHFSGSGAVSYHHVDKQSEVQRRKNHLPIKDQRVLRNVTMKLVNQYGKDVSYLMDCFEAADKSGRGVLSKEDFRLVLQTSGGVNLSDKDFATLSQALLSNQNSSIGVNYGDFVEDLNNSAREFLPDKTVRPVNNSKQRSFQLQRRIGEPVLSKLGSARKAFKFFYNPKTGKVNVDTFLAHVETVAGVKLLSQDVEQMKREFRKASKSDNIDYDIFQTVLFGSPNKPEMLDTKLTLAEEESAAVKYFEQGIADRIRSFVETKRAWGAGMRDTFLLLDKDRKGRLSTSEIVEGLERIGLALSGTEKAEFSRMLSEKSADKLCSYAEFAKVLGPQADTGIVAPVHHLSQRRHADRLNVCKSGNAEEITKIRADVGGTCRLMQALDLLRSRGKTLQGIFLNLKQNQRLTGQTLRSLLENRTGYQLSQKEVDNFLSQGGSCDPHKDISFVEFERMFSAEERTRVTTCQLEMARKTQTMEPFNNGKLSSPMQDALRLSGVRARTLLYPQIVESRFELQQPQHNAQSDQHAALTVNNERVVGVRTEKVLHLKAPPPPPQFSN